MKIGLFGGTFDPIHNVHIDISLSCLEQFGLDEIWFLVDLKPRHKSNVTSYTDRLNMIKLATANNSRLVTDRLEMQKTGKTHDDKSFLELIRDYASHEFFIICGIDTVKHLDKWQTPEIFVKNASFIIIPRPSSDINDLDKIIGFFEQKGLKFRHNVLKYEPSTVSSSRIRADVKKHASDLSKGVFDYIVTNNLY